MNPYISKNVGQIHTSHTRAPTHRQRVDNDGQATRRQSPCAAARPRLGWMCGSGGGGGGGAHTVHLQHPPGTRDRALGKSTDEGVQLWPICVPGRALAHTSSPPPARPPAMLPRHAHGRGGARRHVQDSPVGSCSAAARTARYSCCRRLIGAAACGGSPPPAPHQGGAVEQPDTPRAGHVMSCHCQVRSRSRSGQGSVAWAVKDMAGHSTGGHNPTLPHHSTAPHRIAAVVGRDRRAAPLPPPPLTGGPSTRAPSRPHPHPAPPPAAALSGPSASTASARGAGTHARWPLSR